jgi:hypothetical protein
LDSSVRGVFIFSPASLHFHKQKTKKRRREIPKSHCSQVEYCIERGARQKQFTHCGGPEWCCCALHKALAHPILPERNEMSSRLIVTGCHSKIK